MCTVLLPPGGYPTAVNKYIIYQSHITPVSINFIHRYMFRHKLQTIIGPTTNADTGKIICRIWRRRIFGPRRDEVKGEWRRLHNEELNYVYCSPNTVRVIRSRRMRWAGHVARMGEERGVYRVLVGKPEGKRPLGRPRRRWVNNIRMDLQEVGCGYMDWIGLAQDRDRCRTLVSAVMNLRVPWNTGNFLTSCKPVSFSRRTLHHGVSK